MPAVHLTEEAAPWEKLVCLLCFLETLGRASLRPQVPLSVKGEHVRASEYNQTLDFGTQHILVAAIGLVLGNKDRKSQGYTSVW